MKLNKFFLMLTFLVLLGTTAFAQPYSTVYVDITNGSDSYTGEFATNNPAGRGPKASIGAGLSVLANGGTLYLVAGNYFGSDNAGANLNIATTGGYSQLTTGFTLRLVPLKDNSGNILSTNINLTAGQFILNLNGSGAVLNIVSEQGAVLNQTNTTVTLTAGNINLDASTSWVLANVTTINLNGASTFTNAAPTKTTNINLSYTGGSSFTAGPESNYGSYGTGTITVNKTAGTTVTFPNAITSVAGITVSGGNATFSQAVTVPAGTTDIVNNGTGNLTFNSALNLTVTDGNADANITSIENTSTGSIIVNGTTTWTGGALTTNRDFGSVYGILNSGAGTLTLGAVNLVASDGGANRKYIFEARNSSTGTLTIGKVTATVTSTNSNYGAIRLDGEATAGTINIAGGTYRGFITIKAGHTLNVNGATNLIDSFVGSDGILTNAGTIVLNSNLTLNSGLSVAHLTNGGSISGAAKIIAVPASSNTFTFNGGNLGNFEVNGAGTVNIITNSFNANTMTLTAGTVGLNIGGTISNLIVTGATATIAANTLVTVTNYTQSGGSFTLNTGASTQLDVKGDFSRSGGTFTANTPSLLSFTGSGAQTVNGGSLFEVDKLTFNNVGGTITLGNSIRTTGDVTIATATNVALSTFNLILKGTNNKIINNGSYTATGGGGVILGGVNTVFGGVAGNGYELQGTGTYSYITVDVGSTLGPNISVTANSIANPTQITAAGHGLSTGDVVKFPGSANIPAGFYAVTVTGVNTFTIPVNASADDGAQIINQINAAKVTTTTTGVKWNGVLTLRSGAMSVATATLDFSPTGSSASIIRYPQDATGIQTISLATFNSSNIPYDLTYTGTLTSDQPVGGELTANPANVKSWTVQTTPVTKFNDLPVSSSLSFGGSLTIAKNAAVRIPTGGSGEVFDLTGTNKTHTIKGKFVTVDATDYLKISGANVTLSGGATTDQASIGNIQISSSTLCAISGVNDFAGTFTTLANSVVNLGMNSTAATQKISGAVTFGGTSLTLTTNIEAKNGVSHTAGSLNFGNYNLQLTTAGNFSGTGGTYTSSGGYLVMNQATATITAASAIPNLKILANTSLAGDIEVSNSLQVGTDNATAAPTLTLGSNNLTFSGSSILLTGDGTNTSLVVSNNATTNDGNLIITGDNATITLDGQNAEIEEMTLNSNGSLAIANLPTSTQRKLTITDEFTQTKGDLNTGINLVSLEGDATNNLAYTQTAGNVTSTTVGNNTGWLVFKFGAAAAFSPQGVAIDNLKIEAAATNNNPTKQVTINKQLWLTKAYNNADAGGANDKKLALADGVLITDDGTAGGSLTKVPSFGNNVDIKYVSATTTGNEVPSATTDVLRNVTVTTGTITLSADMKVKGTLLLSGGNITNGGNVLTLASGATLEYNGGILLQAPTVTNYNLTYNTGVGGTFNTTNNEFQSGKVDLLTVKGSAGIILNSNKSVKNLTLNSTAANGIDLNGKVLTMTGDMNYTAGTIVNTAGSGSLTFGGTTLQTITVPSSGWNLPANVNITLNNSAGFKLTGGNLVMGNNGIIYFVDGILTTDGNTKVILYQTNTGQGFDRSGVVSPAVSHINGNVTHNIAAGAGSPTVHANGRYEFPVGTSTQYRPFAITFTSSYPAINPTSVTVKMVDDSPEGTNNLPLDAGSGLKIGSYAPYYWLVKTSPSSFTSTQLFDVELQGTNIGIPYTSDQSLRIIRRQDGTSTSNGWSLQAGSTYANYSIYNSPTDTTAVVRTTASIGGIVIEGTRFAIGVPSRAPQFTAPVSDTKNVDEGATETVQFTAVALNANETISYSLVSGPTWATLNTTSGLLTLKPGYSDASTTPYQVVVRATANPTGIYVDYTLKVTVINKNQKPVFTASSLFTSKEIPYGTEFPWNFAATDADGETLKFMVTLTPTPAGTYSISNAAGNVGIFKFTPTFADLNKTFTLTLSVTDDIDTVIVSTPPTIKVIGKYQRGDANLSGGVADIDDAVAILKHVVQNPVLGAENLVYADANLDGVVNTLDASWILKFIQAGNDWTKVSKSTAAAGTVDFGKANNENGLYNLPISIANTKGVTSIYTEVEVNNGVEVKGISVRLPEGWISSSVVENGKVKFAAAGTNPLNDGVIANVQLKLENKEAVVSVVGNAKLNEEISASLNAKVREIPSEFAVSQNYPNPFNPTTTIKFAIANDARVNLVVYDMLGQKVRTLIDGEQEAGYYSVRWDGTNDFGSKVSSGIYIYRLQAGNFVKTMKMNLMK